MMLRLLACAVVVGTIFVLSPERRQPIVPEGTTAAVIKNGLVSAAGAEAGTSLAQQVTRSLLTDGIERARQLIPGESKPRLEAEHRAAADAKPEERRTVPRNSSPRP
jgi:hypothetical protein